MTTAQVVETSVTVNNNSPIQDYVQPDDQTQPFDKKKTIRKIPLGSLTWRFGSYIMQAANCKFNLFNLFSAQAVQQLLNNLRPQHFYIVPTEQRWC